MCRIRTVRQGRENGSLDLLYKKTCELTEMRKAKHYSTQILSKQGEVLIENAQVQARWKEYVEELYDKNNKPRAHHILMIRIYNLTT